MSPRELVAGLDGLDFHRRILQEGSNRLKEGGRIFVEIGDRQSDRVEVLLLEAYGYDDTFFRGENGGIDRVALARRDANPVDARNTRKDVYR